MAEIVTLVDEFATLARLALSGRQQDVHAFLQKTARRYQASLPEITEKLMSLLREAPNRSSPLRRENGLPVPVDFDSRLQLVRVEHPNLADVQPILPASIREALDQVVSEHSKFDELAKAGLSPSRTILFVGPPGVGKTLSGRWIAARLEKPLLVLDLSAVMSSYLGKTGGNVRSVIDYAKSERCILFLDEVDAVAKRRDDSGEIGELKRLVTVILQEIDDWPSGSLLLAATNHPDLLDPAIWRRFDHTVEFPHPGIDEIRQAVVAFLGADLDEARDWVPLLNILLKDQSLSNIERALMRARRQRVINGSTIGLEFESLVKSFSQSLPSKERLALGVELQNLPNMSDHRIHDLTGVSRVTLKKKRKPNRTVKRGRRKRDG